MKKMAKIVALCMAALMIIGCFAACGEPAEKAGDNSKTIKIGGIGPLTGDNAQYGLAVQSAVQIAVDEINKAGGVNGIKLEFKMEDDVSDAEKSVNAYNNLKDWGMKILLGTVTTGACIAVTDKTRSDNMFQLTPSASAVEVIANDNCFQVCFTDPNQGIASADYIADHKLASKVAVIYDSSNEYSTGIYNNFKTESAKKGLTIASEQSFTKDSNKDFSAQIAAIKSSGAELVFMPIYYSEAALILQQCKAQGFAPKFFGCDGLDGLLNIKNFDKSIAEDVLLLTPFAADAKDEKTQKFVSAYKAANNNETPNQFAADAYDGVYIIKALIEKGAITADMGVADVCEAMKKAIVADGFSVDGLTGSGMTWKATGEVNKAPKAVQIKNGVYVSFE